MATFTDVDFDPFASKSPAAKPSTFDSALSAEGVSGPAADIARSIYQQESGGGRNTKTSNAGAVGGMQVIPATFNRMSDQGWDIKNPEHNARAGIRYVKTLHERAGGDPALTAAGYYGGEGAIDKARKGIAVSDPRNPNAPNTLEYGRQVASRLPKSSGPTFTDVDFDPFAQPAAAPNQAAPVPNAPPLNRLQKLAKGLRDPIDGGAQLLTNMLPDSVVKAGNAANNWLADKTGLVGRLPEGGVNQQVKEGEKAYQQARTASGETGFDGYRILGNLINPANLAVGAKLPQAASMMGRIGIGAAYGAGSGAVTPVAGDDFAGEKIKQIGMGAITGGVMPVATGAIARIISPNASKNANLQLLKAEGVRPTIGQTLGGAWNTAEQKLQSVPIVGDAITSARGATRDQLNTAAYNRALNPIGQQAQSGAVGREGVQSVKTALGKAYDNLLPKLKFQSDPQFGSEMSSLTTMVGNGNVKPEFAKQFNSIVKNEVNARMTPQGAMDGPSFKALESSLSQKIKAFSGAQDPDQRALGSALQEVLNSARGVLGRTNPQYASELSSINKGYANYATIRRAASGVGANEGIFTPAQLQSAVRAGDKSAGKGAFATGNGLMQDLSEAGKTVLGNNYPDSGTAGRLMGGIGAIATGAINPAIPAALIGGAAAYTKPVQSILRAAVSSRPQIAQPAAGAIRKYASSLVPLGAQLGLDALKE